VRIVLSTAARRDRREAEAYYQRESAGAREAFRRNLNAALRFLTAHPLAAPIRSGDIRAKTLLHFPYSVIYKVVGDRLFVLAIANQRRDPAHNNDRFG
jgi:plasmid stabilization system protein ParE